MDAAIYTDLRNFEKQKPINSTDSVISTRWTESTTAHTHLDQSHNMENNNSM